MTRFDRSSTSQFRFSGASPRVSLGSVCTDSSTFLRRQIWEKNQQCKRSAQERIKLEKENKGDTFIVPRCVCLDAKVETHKSWRQAIFKICVWINWHGQGFLKLSGALTSSAQFADTRIQSPRGYLVVISLWTMSSFPLLSVNAGRSVSPVFFLGPKVRRARSKPGASRVAITQSACSCL